jgi:hypothetical protein
MLSRTRVKAELVEGTPTLRHWIPFPTSLKLQVASSKMCVEVEPWSDGCLLYCSTSSHGEFGVSDNVGNVKWWALEQLG